MTYPLRRTWTDEDDTIPQIGTEINNEEFQAIQKRLEDFSIYELAHLVSTSGFLVVPEVTSPSAWRLTMSRNSSAPCRYIHSTLGMWEIPSDQAIDFNQLTSGVAVDRYDYLYLELFRYNNTAADSNKGKVGFRLNIYQNNSNPNVSTSPDVSTSTRNTAIESDHVIFGLRRVKRYQTTEVDETNITDITNISVEATLNLGSSINHGISKQIKDPTINSSLFSSAQYEAQTSANPANTIVPAYGFHIPNIAGKALYMNHSGELRTINNASVDERLLVSTNLATSANALYATNENGNVVVTPNGTGDFQASNIDCRNDNTVAGTFASAVFGNGTDNALMFGSAYTNATILAANNAVNTVATLYLNCYSGDQDGANTYSRSLMPVVSGYSLGGESNKWGAAYIDNLLFDGETIATTNTNGNLVFAPHGTGINVSERRFQYNGDVNTESHGLEVRNDYPTASGTKTGIGFGGYRDVDPNHLVAKIVADNKQSSAGDAKHACDLVFYGTDSSGDLAEYMRIAKGGDITVQNIDARSSNGIGSTTWIKSVFGDGANSCIVAGTLDENGDSTGSVFRAVLGAHNNALTAWGDLLLNFQPNDGSGGDVYTRGLKMAADDTYDIGTITQRVKNIYATNGTIQTSCLTQKDLVEESDLGLEFLKNLRPIKFKWKDSTRIVKKLKKELVRDQYGEIIEPAEYEDQILPVINTQKHYGLGAQDVKKVLDKMGINSNDFAGWVRDLESGRQGLRYTEFIPILIQSVKELSQEVDLLKTA